MRKALKILHTLGGIGFCGAIAALVILHASLPDPGDLERFAALRVAMGNVAEWLLLPSMALVLVSGLLAMAYTRAYLEAGWVWAKLVTGVLIFEGTLVAVQGPMQRAAERARSALAGETDVAELGTTLPSEWGSFWVILGVGVVNVVLGVWRPRFSKDSTEGSG